MLEKEIKDLKEDLEYYKLMDGMNKYKIEKYKLLILQLNELLCCDMQQIDVLNSLIGDSGYVLKEILDELDLNLDDYEIASHAN